MDSSPAQGYRVASSSNPLMPAASSFVFLPQDTPLQMEHSTQERSSLSDLPKFPDRNRNVISRNAARERSRVKSLRNAFHSLQRSLPSVPPNTKLSKLDVLILATTYISHLRRILNEDETMEENREYVGRCSSSSVGRSVSGGELREKRSLRWESSYLHPVRKWPMRSRLYAGVDGDDNSTLTDSSSALQRNGRWT